MSPFEIRRYYYLSITKSSRQLYVTLQLVPYVLNGGPHKEDTKIVTRSPPGVADLESTHGGEHPREGPAHQLTHEPHVNDHVSELPLAAQQGDDLPENSHLVVEATVDLNAIAIKELKAKVDHC